MASDQASLTAIGAALMRAVHSRSDPDPLFQDEWAGLFADAAMQHDMVEGMAAGLADAEREALRALPQDVAIDRLMHGVPSYGNVIVRALLGRTRVDSL